MNLPATPSTLANEIEQTGPTEHYRKPPSPQSAIIQAGNARHSALERRRTQKRHYTFKNQYQSDRRQKLLPLHRFRPRELINKKRHPAAAFLVLIAYTRQKALLNYSDAVCAPFESLKNLKNSDSGSSTSVLFPFLNVER